MAKTYNVVYIRVQCTLDVFSPILQVKSFYEAEIKNIKGRVTQVPEYPRWFVPCVKKWLQHFQRKAVDFVDNAWEDDKITFGVRELKKLSVAVM